MTFKIVVIGASLGGFSALKTLLGGLPKDFALPVTIAQHRGRNVCDVDLSALLQHHCPLPVGEPEDKEDIVPGRVYIAPADYHLLVEEGNFALSTEGPVISARPSIDVLFESAAVAYGTGVVGVLLSGASRDGAEGLARIKKHGGVAVVQDPKTAEFSVMPSAGIESTQVDRILTLPEIPRFLIDLLNGSSN